MATKPYQTKASDLKPVWHELDAEGKTLGRLSTEIATILQGKHKPIYVPHLNTGDYVVVTNVEKIHVTGKKIEQKMYYRHSGYPGGLKEENLERVLAKHPDRALRHAVKGMLPKNALGKKMLSRLKLYASESHPHEAQIKGNAPVEETVIPDSLDKIRVISPDDPLTKGITEPPEQSADSSKTKTRKPKTTVSKNTKNEADKLPEKPKTTPRKRRSPKSAAKTEEA